MDVEVDLDLGTVQGGIVSFTHEDVKAVDIQRRLRAAGINVSVSPRRYTRLDMEDRGLSEVVRASVHYYNTEDEIGFMCEELARAG